METVLLSISLLLIISLQLIVSRTKSISLKLLLPIIFLVVSFRYLFNLNTEIEIYGRIIKLVNINLIILRSIGIFFILNIPTMILLTIGFSDNRKLIEKIMKKTEVLD